MAIYTQRQFLKAIKLRTASGTRIDVLCYIQFNENTKYWEIDYCNKVTKDTMKVNLPVIQQLERQGALILLDRAIADANS